MMPVTINNAHRWFAVRCAVGREKRVCEAVFDLCANENVDVTAYTPFATRWRRVRFSRKYTRREKFDLALFPGIVFVWCGVTESGPDVAIDEAHYAAIKGVEGVRDFYQVRNAAGEGRAAPLPSRAILQIQVRESQGEFDETRPKAPDYTPAIGDRAFVEDGDWVSQIGEILKIKAKQGTATLIIDGRKVKARLKTLRPEPKEEIAA